MPFVFRYPKSITILNVKVQLAYSKADGRSASEEREWGLSRDLPIDAENDPLRAMTSQLRDDVLEMMAKMDNSILPDFQAMHQIPGTDGARIVDINLFLSYQARFEWVEKPEAVKNLYAYVEKPSTSELLDFKLKMSWNQDRNEGRYLDDDIYSLGDMDGEIIPYLEKLIDLLDYRLANRRRVAREKNAVAS